MWATTEIPKIRRPDPPILGWVTTHHHGRPTCSPRGPHQK